MSNQIAKTFGKLSFWLAAFLHLLVFLLFTTAFVFNTKSRDESPAEYVPAYVYTPPFAEQSTATVSQKISSSPFGIKKPVVASSKTLASQPIAHSHSQKVTEPVHLIGNKNIKKPLISLLGKALTAHLIFPKIAIDFNLKGTSLVGFVIHEDGRVTDAALVKSSGTEVLDKAALAGIIAMSPVKNVNLYLSKPEYLVVGIIFG